MRSVFDTNADNIFDDPADLKVAMGQSEGNDGSSPPSRTFITISQVSRHSTPLLHPILGVADANQAANEKQTIQEKQRAQEARLH